MDSTTIIVSIVVALIGFFGSALGALLGARVTVWQFLKERTKPYEEMIHAKKFQEYGTLMDGIYELYNQAHRVTMYWEHGSLVEDNVEELIKDSVEISRKFERDRQKFLIYASKEVAEKVEIFLNACVSVLGEFGVSKPLDQRTILRDLYLACIQAIRNDLGSDYLSQQTLNLFGQSSAQLDQQKKQPPIPPGHQT